MALLSKVKVRYHGKPTPAKLSPTGVEPTAASIFSEDTPLRVPDFIDSSQIFNAPNSNDPNELTDAFIAGQITVEKWYEKVLFPLETSTRILMEDRMLAYIAGCAIEAQIGHTGADYPESIGTLRAMKDYVCVHCKIPAHTTPACPEYSFYKFMLRQNELFARDFAIFKATKTAEAE